MVTVITFGELKGYINVDTKEPVVPSRKKLQERKTPVVIEENYGSFQTIEVIRGGKTVFQSARPGTFEDITMHSTGGRLGEFDMSVKNRLVMVRLDDGTEIVISSTDEDVDVIVDEYVNDTEEPTTLQVFVDGSVFYRSEGRQTVFPILKCRGYQYDSVKKAVAISSNKMDEMPWNIRLAMMGEDKLAHNLFNHKKEILWNSVDEDGEDDTDADEELWKVFLIDYVRSENQRDMVEAMLLSLDDTDRRILEMSFFERETQKEIAEVLGIARETVSRKMTRIIKGLKEWYGAKGALYNM